MPNTKFCFFISNFRNALTAKKLDFLAPYSVLNEAMSDVLVSDGFLLSFCKKNKHIFAWPLKPQLTNIVSEVCLYSTPSRLVNITYFDLCSLTLMGGYYVLSTPFGVMNDFDAWQQKLGGILLIGIF